jgi:hypothetical protein
MNEQVLMHLSKQADDIIEKLGKPAQDKQEREYLKTNLLGIHDQLIEIQEARIGNILESGEKPDELSSAEYNLQRDLNQLILRIESFIKVDE